MNPTKQKGQIPIITTSIIAITTILASVIGSWTTANSRVDSIDTKVQLVSQREEIHYLELTKKLDSIESKLDRMINRR